MNILLINHYAGSTKHGMEYRPYYLAREWVRMGHQVTIVAGSFSHLHSRRPETSGMVTEEIIDGIRYCWLKTPEYKRNGAGRLINMATFSLRLSTRKSAIINTFKPDVVIASSPHPFIIFGARKIARSSNAKLVFEVRDLWPLSLTEFGRMSRRHPFIVFMQKSEDYSYCISDYVVSLLPKADSYMCEHGMSADKFIYIPNGICVEEWRNNNDILPEQHSALLARLKKEGQFIVGYTGYHGLTDTLYTFINAAALLRDKPISFVLVGQGLEKEMLMKKASELSLNNVFFLSAVPKASMPKLLDSMDALYIGCERNYIYRFGVSPNKLMDYFMAAKPVIYAIEAANDMVAESGSGISIPPNDAGAIAEAVTSLARMSDAEKKELGLRGREYILANHEYKGLAEKFLDALL